MQYNQDMNQLTSKTRKTLIVGLVILVILVLAVSVLSRERNRKISSTFSSTPSINWSKPEIYIAVSPNEPLLRDITFTPSEKIKKASFEISPDIAQFVSIQPRKIKKAAANQPQQIHLSFLIPQGSSFRKYEGTIRVVTKEDTLLSQPLNVILNNWFHFEDAEMEISINHPPTWNIAQGLNSVVFSNAIDSSEITDEALASQSSFEVRVITKTNQNKLPLSLWFDQHFSDGFPVNLDSKVETIVNGHPAIRIEVAEVGGRQVHYYIEKGRDIVEVSYGLFTPQFVPEYEMMLDSLILDK